MESRHGLIGSIGFKRITRVVVGTILLTMVVALVQSPAAAFASAQLRSRGASSTHYSLGLVEFSGKVTKTKKVHLYWDTGTEVNLVGFNVWKKAGNGEFVLLNANLIPARTGLAVGNSYSLLDKRVKPGTKYRYKLEVISVDGYSAWSDAVSLKVR